MNKRLRSGERIRTFNDGEVIFREGDHSREMYIVQTGRVVLAKSVQGSERILGSVGRGGYFGDMSLLEGQPRTATARVVGTTRVLVLTATGLLDRIRHDPTYALEMLRDASHRVRRRDIKLVRLARRSDLPDELREELLYVLDFLDDPTQAAEPEAP